MKAVPELGYPLLSLIVFVPWIGAAVLALLRGTDAKITRIVALLLSFVPLAFKQTDCLFDGIIGERQVQPASLGSRFRPFPPSAPGRRLGSWQLPSKASPQAQKGPRHLGQRFPGSNHIRRPRRAVGPGVDDGMAIDVVDASHDAFLEFVL